MTVLDCCAKLREMATTQHVSLRRLIRLPVRKERRQDNGEVRGRKGDMIMERQEEGKET